MKKKALLLFAVVAMLMCALAVTVSAQNVYLEPIPEELKAQDDTITHFVVFEEAKYFTGSGNTISGLNSDEMEADMNACGIDKSKIGAEYLTRYNFPAYMGENLITYVNLNAIKTHKYFKNVCGYIQLEGTVNKVHDMNECVAQLRCIDFGENSQITTIPLCFSNQAKKMASVKNFPKNLTYIGKSAFDNCYGAFRGELCLNATTIESAAFNNAISNVTRLILGPDVKSIGTQALTVLFDTYHHNEIPKFYAPADGKAALEYIEFQGDVSQIKFANQGVNTGAFYFPVSTGRSPYEKLTSIVLSHPNNAKFVTEGSVFNDFTQEGVTILFNDADGLDDYVTANHEFSIFGGISYERFNEEGKKSMMCSICGAVSYESVAPLFECLGYSAPVNGMGGLSIGFKANNKAIEEYEALTGKEIKYGVFAASQKKLGNSDIFDENGNANAYAITAEIKATEFSVFELKINGFTTDEQKSAQLAIGAYVKVSEEYSYMQGKAPNDGENYHFTSFNEVLLSLK